MNRASIRLNIVKSIAFSILIIAFVSNPLARSEEMGQALLNKYRPVENRLQGLRELSENDPKKAGEIALIILRNEEDNKKIRMRVAEFFAGIRENNLMELRTILYSRSELPSTRLYTLRALEKFDALSTDDAQSLALNSTAPVAVRCKALLMLDKRAGEKGLEVLLRLVGSKSQPVHLRISAIGRLGNYDDERVHEVIARVIRDKTEEPDIKIMAIAVALNQRLESLRPDLLEVIADGFETTRVRLAALDAVGEMGDASVIPKLKEIARDCSGRKEAPLRKGIDRVVARFDEEGEEETD